jgi:Ras-related protein Rab-5C
MIELLFLKGEMLARESDLRHAKIVLVGSLGVGKTSLMRRVIEGIFSPIYEVTIAVSYRELKVTISGHPAALQLWDTGGMERYSSVGPIYYRGAHAALFVYDLSNPASAAEVSAWHEAVSGAIGGKFYGIVVAHKLDLAPEPDTSEMEQWAGERQLGFVTASAKTGVNVDHLFDMAAQGAFLIKNTELFERENSVDLKAKKGRCC